MPESLGLDEFAEHFTLPPHEVVSSRNKTGASWWGLAVTARFPLWAYWFLPAVG